MIEITHRRLVNQLIAASNCRKPEEVVAALGAMQAQDYTGVLWSVGLRVPGVTESDVEQAIAERKIVRTWPMRGTLHLVAAQDIHWLLDLLAPAMLVRRARLMRESKLDPVTLARCEKLFVRALQGQQLSREALMKLLEQNKISTADQRGYHILWWLALQKVICFGPRIGKQHTFVLMEEWIPAARKRNRDKALAEIALRYFTSHGPATLQDFAGWTGLSAEDARAALDGAASRLSREKIGDQTYWTSQNSAKVSQDISDVAFLLPGFDEYLLGYKDRGAVLDPQHAQKIAPTSNGRFQPTIILNGRVAGTWQRLADKRKCSIKLYPFNRLAKAHRAAIEHTAERYGKFLGLAAEIIA